MNKFKRAFLIVLDSFGAGFAPDAAKFGDDGAYTLGRVSSAAGFSAPELQRLGLFNIDKIPGTVPVPPAEAPVGAYARVHESSDGKDTTTGHLEIAGIISENPMPTYPHGFPDEIMDEFCRLTGRGYLCNLPYSGTEVIKDFGKEHLETGKLIVYTSADSVFQIAAHTDIVPVETLYSYCEAVRKLLVGKHNVGRVIARPFYGEYPFTRSPDRRDFASVPPRETMLDVLSSRGYDTIGVGKIRDIFAGVGLTRVYPVHGNRDCTECTSTLAREDFNGLAFINLVDFDMSYGHRRDIKGYANAITGFDTWLTGFIKLMRKGDILMITADHGCDPGFRGTDHTREDVPLLIYGSCVKPVNLGTLDTYADIAATVADIFGGRADLDGKSFLEKII